tara:strand:+ start:837 stop:1052 length:216 start_codon:yes stop_codon:yes gene_type:complete
MKKGDLVRIAEAVVTIDDRGELVRNVRWIKGIVVRDYTGNKLIKIYVPKTGLTKKYHASQVQMHKRMKENY